jgi:dolichyl-phosphate-mannose-protein mannosyltransferase
MLWRVAALIGLFYLVTIRPGQRWGDDFAQYVHHARNIASGAPYAETGYIYNPHNPAIGPRTYPPGFPLLLAPVVKLFGLDFRPMKILIVVCFAGVLLLMPHVFRRDLPAPYLAALILVTGLNPYFLDIKDDVISDIPFLCFTLLSLYAFQRAEEPDNRRPLTTAVLAGLATYLSVATRVLGVVLIPCFLLHDLLRRRRITGMTAVTCGVAVVLTGVQYAVGPRDGSYFDQLALSATTVARNAVAYLRALSDIWDNGYTDLGRKAVFVVTAGLAVYGYRRALRLGPTAVEIFPWLYIVPVIVWPANQGTRFLIPLIPFYLYYCMLGIRGLNVPLQARRRVIVALGVVVALLYGGKYSMMRFGPLADGVATPESVELFEFVKQATPPEAVFVFSRPRALALFTDRRASAPVVADDPCRLWQYFAEIGADYVITGPPASNEEAAYLERFVSAYPAGFRRDMGNRALAVYRIIGSPCAGSPSMGSIPIRSCHAFHLTFARRKQHRKASSPSEDQWLRGNGLVCALLKPATCAAAPGIASCASRPLRSCSM